MPEDRTVRVFAPGAYAYRNKGDATLVLAFIAWLRTAFEDPDITLTSFEPMDSAHYGVPVLEMATRPLRPLKIIGHRIGGRIPGIRGLIPYLVYSYTAAVCWLLRQWVWVYRSQPDIAARLAPSHILRLARAIDAADVVITVPGGYLLAPALTDDWWLFHLPTLELARALGKPLILSPCSLGPFAGFHREVARRFLNVCERLYVREEWSRDYVLGLGVAADRVTYCPDLAFMFRDGDIETVAPIEIPGVDSGDDRPLLGISVKWHSFPGSDDPQARRRLYMKALADMADFMIEHHGARIVIVPQTLEDLKAGRALYGEIPQRGDVVLLEDDLSPADLQRLYARCRILIGTRMHANILAMGVNTPVVAIAYQPKTTGIMAAMGLDNWVLSIDDVGELVARAQDLWIHADDVRELLPGKVGALRAEATTAAQELRAMTTGAGQLANRPDMTKGSNGSALDTDQMSIVGRAEDS
jgi:colanic acid/amylovoran biosynthesis protein